MPILDVAAVPQRVIPVRQHAGTTRHSGSLDVTRLLRVVHLGRNVGNGQLVGVGAEDGHNLFHHPAIASTHALSV